MGLQPRAFLHRWHMHRATGPAPPFRGGWGEGGRVLIWRNWVGRFRISAMLSPWSQRISTHIPQTTATATGSHAAFRSNAAPRIEQTTRWSRGVAVFSAGCPLAFPVYFIVSVFLRCRLRLSCLPDFRWVEDAFLARSLGKVAELCLHIAARDLQSL